MKFISFHKVKKSKGVLDCIKAVNKLSNQGYNINLNIFGKNEKGFENDFNEFLINNKSSKYIGMLNNFEVIETLSKNADFLLLPTYYPGEGLPGILVESSIAKVPVLMIELNGINYYFHG